MQTVFPSKNQRPLFLLAATRHLVEQDPRPLKQLAKALRVSLPWLKKFKAGKIKSPNVNRVQSVYEKLSGKALLSS
jgi:hypothetical protein